MCRSTVGRLCGRQIMSPRETSRSASSLIVTDIGAQASSRDPFEVSTEVIRASSPLGNTTTGSPARDTPAAICPAYPR